MRRAHCLSTLFLASALLAGCATVPPQVPGGVITPDPDELVQWIAKGRIALAARGEGGSGSFVWQQRSERTELSVRGPLGAGGLSVVTDGNELAVTDASGQSFDGQPARAALEQKLGASLPLAELRYWLLGRPAPESVSAGAVQTLPGPVPGFVQGGWVVSYDEYRPTGRWSLPARLTATTAAVKVRIVVDDWQLP